MAKSNSYAGVIDDWLGLLEAVERNPEVQPSLDTERQSLASVLKEVQDLKARQEELKALRQEITQKLSETVGRGKEVAIRVRSVVRGKVGPKSERLVHFKVAPLRKRPRKPEVVFVTKPADGEGATPGVSASPSSKPVA